MMAGKKIFLLVDDDEDDREIFEEVLLEVDSSASLQKAANGFEALELLRSSTKTGLPVLIFMDLNMPRMSGKECLHELKSREHLKHIPVIVYTTSTLPRDKRELTNEGAVAYIVKPTNIRSLRKLIRMAVQTEPLQLAEALEGFVEEE